jgi:hypothetical protein
MITLKNKFKKIISLRKKAEELKSEAYKIQNEIKKEAMDLLLKVSMYKKIEHIEKLNFVKIDEDNIHYKCSIYAGRDFYNQDEYDEIEFKLPAELLYNSTTRNEYLCKIKNIYIDQNNKELLKKEMIERKKIEKEKELYYSLKTVYETK